MLVSAGGLRQSPTRWRRQDWGAGGSPPVSCLSLQKIYPQVRQLETPLASRLEVSVAEERGAAELCGPGWGGLSGGAVRRGRRTPRGTSHGCWQKAWVPCLMGPRAAWVPHHTVPPRRGWVTQLGEALPSPPPTLLLSGRSHVQVTLKGRDVAASFLRTDFKASAGGHFGQQQ